MTDRHPSEDAAVLYLLDRLSAAERREFEARLAESAELRDLLRELEDGAVALTMAVPPCRPPPQVWQRIESAVARERLPESGSRSHWFRWWRYGWAAAALCLIAWLVHVLWLGGSANRLELSSQNAPARQDATLAESRDGTITGGQNRAPSP